MKYYIVILSLVAAIFVGFFVEFSLPVFIALITALFMVLFTWECTVFFNKFSGRFQMKSHKKFLDFPRLLVSFTWIFIFIREGKSWDEFDVVEITLLLLCSSFILLETGMSLLYMLKKPATVFIDNDTLIYNNPWLKKRDLKNLNYIGISNKMGELELGFVKKSDVRLPFREYDKKEFRQFLEILVEKSTHDVYLTEKVAKKFPATVLPTVK
jgi:hypothetical protein